ncbi:glutathione peroxidase [Gilvimarinus agarilyticus]|uniref:glutathione peroxidase n=1 Tax=Gilvimarinus sp. 2_MG-2023 TaxID=3062666 RepID=UPI001C0A55EC|nr:glutathione peroxidase [Gilvimarinus sp. 2_MG-2023]MBU2884471.1 glutathione peroxidase [Gilvimarinus agarilyticus]MDO6569607.1 glutathione peroxidase [Gilvimarinus sp. 2_MG-2023]
MAKIHKFSIDSLDGDTIDFASFEGKVLLLVNTASKCGLTPQYEGLQALHTQYAEQGLVIIGFPCNQFGEQEPGDATQIQNGCLLNYGVDFLMTEKIDVNGAKAHPIFQYLKEECPGLGGNDIKWNFTKFLIARDGTPQRRFAPITKPKKLEGKIKRLLAN